MGPVRWAARVLCVAVPAAFLGVFFLYPVGTILVRGLGADGLDRLLSLPGRASFRGVAWFTAWQATVSAVTPKAFCMTQILPNFTMGTT